MGISGVWGQQQVEADYGWQAFFDALCHAIASTGTLQQRVAAFAWSISDLRRQHFAEDDTWRQFEQLLTSIPGESRDRNSINVACLRMSDEQARKWLQQAVQMFSGLSQESES